MDFFIIIVCSIVLIEAAVAQDETVFVIFSESVKLPCTSASKPLTEGITRISWYVTENIDNVDNRISLHLFSNEKVYQGSGYSEHKYVYSKSDYSLTINNVTYGDQMKYTCYQSADTAQTFVNEVIVLVPPAQPSLNIPNFQENTDTSIHCKVSAVKPGVGSVVFTVTIDPDFSIQSSDSDLSEGSADVTTGAVSVTYSPQISLQRKHNGQQAVCTVVWRDGEKTVTSKSENVNVTFTPTSITMHQSPSGLVHENTLISFTCLTDEANPTASVTWIVDGAGRSSTTVSIVDDNNYNALRRESVLTLTADEMLHNRKVKCVVNSNTGITAEETLNIAYVSPPLTLSLSPATSNPVQAGISVTFTCTLDANPAPSYSIWTHDGQSQKWDDVDTNKNSITLSPQKQHNRVNMFCRADGSLSSYPVNSAFKSYTVKFSASTITMTQSPSGPLPENTDVIFTCVTDEAEPTADVVWSVDGNTRTSATDFTEEGMYNTQKKRSVLAINVVRTLNNKKVECNVSGKLAVRDTITLDVTFPHNVQIFENPSDTVLQGVSLTLTCEATEGNPADVLSYNWNFEPRYDVSSELITNTDRELELNNVQYTQVGVYRCEADNGAGVGTSETEILVEFSPIDVSSNIQKVSYSPLKQDATLNCTVRANPVVTKDGVTVRHNGYVIESNQVNVQLMERKTDETVIELSFQPVEISDYGMYEVVASNKVGQQTLQLRLVENGVPEAPHSVVLQSITAISVILSWLPGRSGGSAQTFTVYYRKDGESKILYQDEIEAIEEDELITYKVSGLDPQTKYYFKVQATNSWGESISSLEVPSYTLAKPELKDAPRLIVYDDIGVLQWQTVVGIYNFTVIIECMSVCTTILNYTENSHKSFVLSGDYLGKSYFITAYQSEDEVLRQKFTVEDKRGSDEHDVGLVAGIAVISVVAGLLAMTLIIFYMSLKSGKCNKCFRREHIKGTDETPVASYENAVTKQDAGHYELTRSEESQLPAEYTDLKHITYEVVG